MRTIELHKLNRESRNNHDARFRDSDDPTENGGAEASEVEAVVVDSSPVVVNVEAIRCFYPRTEARPGTRITFTDGGGFAVTEPFDDVKALVAAAA